MTAQSLHTTTLEPLSRVSVVLVEPSHPGNVGATARAMRVMGLRALTLVAPRIPDALRDPQASAFASGATDVLEGARVVGALDEALADATLAVAVSADAREFGPPPLTPEALAPKILAELAAHPQHRVALVFGNERTGLSIDQVARCELLCSIPGDPDYRSLNLAQAVQVLAYVLRRVADGRTPAPTESTAARRASHAAIEGLFAHLERALLAIGFLDPAHPKKLMPRLRRLFARTRLEVEEVDLLRGVCTMAEAAGRANPPPWRASAASQPKGAPGGPTPSEAPDEAR